MPQRSPSSTELTRDASTHLARKAREGNSRGIVSPSQTMPALPPYRIVNPLAPGVAEETAAFAAAVANDDALPDMLSTADTATAEAMTTLDRTLTEAGEVLSITTGPPISRALEWNLPMQRSLSTLPAPVVQDDKDVHRTPRVWSPFPCGAATADGAVSCCYATPDEAANGGLKHPPFSLETLTPPTTAAAFMEAADWLNTISCGLGKELAGAAKDIYGPTEPFSDQLLASPVFGHRHSVAPNCDNRAPIQLTTGPRWWSLFSVFAALLLYGVCCTVGLLHTASWVTVLVLWIFAVLTMTLLAFCAFTNPGIVPRRLLANVIDRGDILVVRVPAPNAQAVLQRLLKESEESGAVASRLCSNAVAGIKEGRIPLSICNDVRATIHSMARHFESENGRIVPYNPPLTATDLAVPTLEFPLTFCDTCRIAKGPRTRHCRICNVCVDEMDHHCPWTNCCIGRNNYPYFFFLLLSAHLYGVYSCVVLVERTFQYIASNPTQNFHEVMMAAYYIPLLVVLFIFSSGFFFTPLLVTHIYMTAKGITTSEMLKKKWELSNHFGGLNPWAHGSWYKNAMSRLLGPWPAPSSNPICWIDSRNYSGVVVASAIEDLKVDWLLGLPAEERQRVEQLQAEELAKGLSLRREQEQQLIRHFFSPSW